MMAAGESFIPMARDAIDIRDMPTNGLALPEHTSYFISSSGE
jgi:hypothetical protein